MTNTPRFLLPHLNTAAPFSHVVHCYDTLDYAARRSPYPRTRSSSSSPKMLFHPRGALLATLVATSRLVSLVSAAPAPSTSNSTSIRDVPDESDSLFARDAFSDQRGSEGNGPRLTSLGTTPRGAFGTTIPVSRGAELFVWHSLTPRRLSDAEAVVIMNHGDKKNAETYFAVLNNMWAKARDAGMAPANTIRLAPLFFGAKQDQAVMNSTSPGWGEPSRWASGDASVTPLGASLSIFDIYDDLIAKYADKTKYPNVKTITLVGHGLGAQVIGRAAVLSKPASGVEVRFVVANPSSLLYFTEDRPVPVNTQECTRFNDFRYGFNNVPFALALSPLQYYKRFAGRDVRYLVATDDTLVDEGDQLECGGRTVGGPYRKDRSFAYWKYINILGGARPASYDKYFGVFPKLDSRQAANSSYPQSSTTTLTPFRGTTINQRLATVLGGHSVSAVFSTSTAMRMTFLPRTKLV